MTEYDITKENDNRNREVFGKIFRLYKEYKWRYFDVSPDMESYYIGVIYFNLDIEQEYKLNIKEHISNDYSIIQYKDKEYFSSSKNR